MKIRSHAALVLALVGAVLVWHADRCSRRLYTGGGDSPYYVMMAKSLARDGDLRLTPPERIIEGYYEDFPVKIAPRIFSEKHPYCWHPVGAPVAFAPAYALGGRRGVLLEIALMATIVVGLLWRYLAQVTGDELAAGIVAVTAGLSVPLLPLAANEYTEMPALLLQMAGLSWLARLDEGRAEPGTALALGLAAGALPWVHVRYLPIALALLGWGLWRMRRWPCTRGWLLAPPAVAAAALYAWGWRATGELTWTLPFTLSGGNQAGQLSPWTLLEKGLLGHLTDQQAGLLVYAPVYALAVLGAGAAWRAWRREVLVHLTYAVPSLLVVSSYYNWSGHWGVPCRFLAVLVPALALALVPVVRGALDRRSHGALALSLPVAVTAAMSLAMLRWPPLQLSLESADVNLGSPFVYLYQRTGISLLTALPRFVYHPQLRDVMLALALLCVVGAWLTFARALLDGGAGRRAGRALALFAAAVVVHAGADRHTRPPGDPLAEDGRWAQFDVEHSMSYPLHYETLAVQALSKGSFAIARRCLERVLEVRPDYPPAHGQLAVLLREVDRAASRRHAEAGIAAMRDQLLDHPDRLFWMGYLVLLVEDVPRGRGFLSAYLKQPGPQQEEARRLLDATR